MTSSNRPVFFDPSSRRWRRVLRIGTVVALGVILLLGALAVGVLINPGLPQLSLGGIRTLHAHRGSGRIAPAARELRFQQAQRDLKEYLARSQPEPSSIPSTSVGGFERLAFFVNWSDDSFVSLKHNLGDIDTLVAEWLHLSSGDGTVQPDDEVKQTAVLNYIRKHRPGLPVSALINNLVNQHWDSAMLKTMLSAPASRKHAIDQIEQFVLRWNLSGVSIDFESVPHESQGELVQFMQELHERFSPQHLTITQSVPVDDESYRFRELARYVDALILMSYDENAADNDAGPIASQEWFTKSITRRMREIPAQKLLIGIGSYGYDWLQGKPTAEELSFQDALRIAAESEGDIQIDDASGNPTFEYSDEQDREHQVWFLDAVTAFNQVKTAARLQPRGFALWRLGSEDPGVWLALNKPAALDASVAEQLRTLHFGYDLDYEGKGEILRVTGTPQDGVRDLNYDADLGLITDDEVTRSPRGYVIERHGFDPNHAIALTFDDGPDSQWTPQILDILKQKNVLATFFLIGQNAESNPDLVERIDREGHEIGNHTYTHPNIADASDRRVMLELTATQRFLESRIGKRSLLFRPPYAEDVEPETPDEVHPLVLTSSLGYYSVGMQIDPDDWRQPGTDEIIKRVLEQAASGEGNVVLLHDAGGDRSQTVEALPRLIDELRAHGYKLVTISDLLHVPRAAVMPPLGEQRDVRTWMQGKGFELINTFGQALRALFILGIVLGMVRSLVIFALASYRGRRHQGVTTGLPAVSVIVPAYNEEQLIERTISTLLESQGVEFEVVVVDDGSTDRTAAIVAERFGSDARVHLLRQANAGKAEALNAGIRHAQHEIIVALDADTLFKTDTVAQLAAHFADPRIGAVAGNAKVGNRLNLLTRWQAVEYVTSQNLERRAFESLNCITVVPGSVGAWRRAAVAKAGGFISDTLAEDADLTMRIVRLGYRIAYEEHAIAFTEAPQTVSAFVKQRFRWMFGTLQASWKHRSILLRPSGGMLGAVALPNVIVFQIFFPLVSPIMDLTMLWTAFEALIGYLQHPASGLSSGFWHTLYYYGLFLAIDFCTALFAYVFEPSEDWRLLPWLPLQRFFYRQLMYYVAIRSFIAALRGPHVGWGRLQRYGSVKTSA